MKLILLLILLFTRTGQNSSNDIKFSVEKIYFQKVKKMKHNNKGYSLVEMIAVLAVWAVLLGGTITMVGYMNGTKAKSAAYTIQSAINKARTEAMSKSTGAKIEVTPGVKVKDVYLEIKQDSTTKDYYVVLHSRKGDTTEYLGNSNLKIFGIDYITTEEDKKSISINNKKSLYIDFIRDTGTIETHPNEFGNVTEIQVKQGNVVYMISFVKVTGKVSLSKGFERE